MKKRIICGRELVPAPEGCIHGFKVGPDKGKVYVYVVVAEQKLGRHLLPEEVVHHIDRNTYNNEPDNLMVFASNSDHAAFHSAKCDISKVRQLPNGSWCMPEENRSRYYCQDCGRRLTDDKAKYCRRCLRAKAKIQDGSISPAANKPIYKAKLQQEVWQKSTSKVALDYGVSAHTICKWCKRFGIALPPRGYWARRENLIK